MAIVFIVTNLINGKKYLGKCIHKKPFYLGSGIALKHALKKYGREFFRKTILVEVGTKEESASIEKNLSILWNIVPDPMWYNLKIGGDGGSVKGQPKSLESRQKNSETNKGRKSWSVGLYGDPRLKHSDEWKDNHSKMMIGREYGIKGSASVHAKDVIFTSPTNLEIHVKGIRQYCRDNKINFNIIIGRLRKGKFDLATEKHPWKIRYAQ